LVLTALLQAGSSLRSSACAAASTKLSRGSRLTILRPLMGIIALARVFARARGVLALFLVDLARLVICVLFRSLSTAHSRAYSVVKGVHGNGLFYIHYANVGWGMAAKRSRVYCACGETRISSVGPCSTMRPACMTMTRSHNSRTTLRSWETNR